MTRWEIRKFPADNDFFGPGGLLWVVWRTGKWTECRAFSTHHEAVEFVDMKIAEQHLTDLVLHWV